MPTDSEFIDIPYAPVGGVNSTDSEDNIGETEVADARNFLFENNQCFTRPGLKTLASTINDTIGAIYHPHGSPYLILVNSAGTKIYAKTFVGVGSEFQITGPTIAINIAVAQVNYINQAYIISGNQGGLVQWVPTAGNVYTILSQGAWQFVSAHYSRAVGLWDISIPQTIIKPLTFGWSVPGDASTWTAPIGTLNGSGSAVLADTHNVPVDLQVLRNVVVLSAGCTIYLAYATGNGASPYNIQKFNDTCPVPIPGTGQTWNNLLFYISMYGDVCTFDLNQVQSIGYKIRKQLIKALETITNRSDFPETAITYSEYRNGNIVNRPRFHIFINSASVYWHFSYDIEDGVWSIHEYDPSISLVGPANASATIYFVGGDPLTIFGPLWYQNITPGSNQYVWWDPQTPCERTPYFKGKVFVVEKPEVDYTLDRALLGTRDYGVQSTTVSVESRLGRQKNVTAATTNTGSSANDGYWGREWFDLLQAGTGSATGQFFQATVTGSANHNFACNYLSMRLHGASEFRG